MPSSQDLQLRQQIGRLALMEGASTDEEHMPSGNEPSACAYAGPFEQREQLFLHTLTLGEACTCMYVCTSACMYVCMYVRLHVPSPLLKLSPDLSAPSRRTSLSISSRKTMPRAWVRVNGER